MDYVCPDCGYESDNTGNCPECETPLLKREDVMDGVETGSPDEEKLEGFDEDEEN